jgi:SIR2-like domain
MKYVIDDGFFIDEFKKYFESSNINFLLGSGCSIDAIATLGNLEKDLTDLIKKYSISQDKGILKQICNKLNNFIESAIIPSDRLLKNEFTEKDGIGKTKRNYIEFLNVIYFLLLNRGSTILPKKINIFTTNYDLFLEIAAESLRIPYNDGGIGIFKRYFSSKNFQRRIYRLSESYQYEYEEPNVNIIKLHGSLNWRLEENPDSILVSNSIECEFLQEKHIEENGYIKKDSKIPIILPTKQKFVRTLMEHTYYDLARLYSNELEREQSVLFCSGFSFEDEHIRTITQRALNNPFLTLFIFPFSYNDEQKILSYFETYNNVKVIRINNVNSTGTENGVLNETEEVHKYKISLAQKGMSDENRVNIDFVMLINILKTVLNKVSESGRF